MKVTLVDVRTIARAARLNTGATRCSRSDPDDARPACGRRNQFNDDPANRPVDRVDPLRSPRPISNVLPNQDETGCRRSRLPRPDQRPVDSPLTKSLTQPVATICCRRRTRSTTTSGRSLSANRLDQRAVNHPSTLESHRAGHGWSMRSWDSVRPGFRRRRGVPRSHGPSGMRFAALKVNNWLTPQHRTPDSVLPQPWGSSRGQAGGRYAQGPLLAVGLREVGRNLGRRAGNDGRPARRLRAELGAVS